MIFFDFTHATEVLQSDQKENKSRVLPYLLFYGNVFLSLIVRIYYSMNIKFGTKFIIALCDVLRKSFGHVDFILKIPQTKANKHLRLTIKFSVNVEIVPCQPLTDTL
jgi:hypothetical protein